MTNSPRVLLEVLRDPARMAGLDLAAWNILLPQARIARLLPRLAILAQEAGLLNQLPDPVQPHLQAGLVLARRHEQAIRWEICKIVEALQPIDTPIILLKGAAYLALGMDIARGRMYSDTDILVYPEKIADVEQVLLKNGWHIAIDHPYDEEYFRQWMHELPPLEHAGRQSLLDVHHTILPLTDTLKLNPRLLFSEAVPVPDQGVFVLAPHDMAIHNAIHLFRNGDFSVAVRDLADLDYLLRRFGVEASFWEKLEQRAQQMDVALPLACAVRYVRKYFQTPIPDAVVKKIQRWLPGRIRLRLVDWLVDRSLLPRGFDRVDTVRNLSIALLSYWPLPRLRTMLTSLFWIKRLPRWVFFTRPRVAHRQA